MRRLIAVQTMLNCIDNSGAAIVECIAVMRKKKQAARIGLLDHDSLVKTHLTPM